MRAIRERRLRFMPSNFLWKRKLFIGAILKGIYYIPMLCLKNKSYTTKWESPPLLKLVKIVNQIWTSLIIINLNVSSSSFFARFYILEDPFIYLKLKIHLPFSKALLPFRPIHLRSLGFHFHTCRLWLIWIHLSSKKILRCNIYSVKCFKAEF